MVTRKSWEEFTKELGTYKGNSTGNAYLGDLNPKYNNGELRPRYNVNSYGDIYFINSGYVNRCMMEAFKYKEDSKRESVGFKKKTVLEDISNHHNFDKVKEIVEKYFTIV